MRISFALTKEYDVWIDMEEIDKKYCGDTKAAVKDKLKEAEETDVYINDIEILEEEKHFPDLMYQARRDAEWKREEDLQEIQYYRDLI